MPSPHGTPAASDLLRLTDEQFARLRALTHAPEEETDEQRNARAVRLAGSHLGSVVVSLSPAAGLDVAAFTVRTLNVSRTGLAFVHGAPAYAGTACAVSVQTRTGEQRVIQARVVRCRRLDGRAHEVGLRFDESVDLAELITCEPSRCERPAAPNTDAAGG
ncbi:MAG: hypothetical protein DHS20C14_11090 [Phycisphaeraceae bacterium]|nr:MAG: hypothetical protein DHS20C14_11090 [Phycisphaeraceae bacterium]